MIDMESRWSTLHLPSAGVPSLLIKAHLNQSGYTIHLTDLSRIWGETLSKRDITRRAWDDSCSIDPSDGIDQYDILLQKIGDALNQKDSTNLTVKSSGGDDLVLDLAAPLPKPLPELQWTVKLALLPPEQLEAHLVSPLLQQSRTLQSQVQSLAQELHEKDRVISKICDRLETSGNELSIVFPHVSNIKINRKSNKSHREQLAPHVRSLGDFDEKSWRNNQRTKNDVRQAMDDHALGQIVLGLEVNSNDSPKAGHGAWWHNLSTNAHTETAASYKRDTDGSQSQSSGKSSRTLRSSTKIENSVEEDDFQHQVTPPHLKPRAAGSSPASQGQATQRVVSSFTQERKHGVSPTAAIPDDESTEDEEEDLDAAPKRRITDFEESAKEPRRSEKTSISEMGGSSLRRLGNDSGRKWETSPARAAVPSHETSSTPEPVVEKNPSPLPKAAPKPQLGAIGGKKQTTATATPEPAPLAHSPQKPARSKLGAIGGKSKVPTASDPVSTSTAAQETKVSAHKSKLGTIGGGRKASRTSSSSRPTSRSSHDVHSLASKGNAGAENGDASDLERPPGQQAKEPTPPPRETSQERADKKRLDLKRQLDEKSKSAAGKKKRKF